jgi:Protein of unknown function (DUF2510)
MSYQQPPEHQTDPPQGLPPGWYPDPGGLRMLRWWDGARWTQHTEPLPQPPPPYPNDAAAWPEADGVFGQESTGRHPQQRGPAQPPGLSSDPYPAAIPPAEVQESNPYEPQGPQDPYQPARWPQQQPHGRPPRAQPHRAPRRPRKRPQSGFLVVGAVIAVAGAALGLWLGGVFGPSAFTAHGAEQVCADAPDITDGTQVTVTDSSGHVIGTGTLAEDDSPAAMAAEKQYDQLQLSLGALGGGGPGMSIYTFTATVPGGEPRYGIAIGQNRGTVWFSQSQMRSGPQLSLGC